MDTHRTHTLIMEQPLDRHRHLRSLQYTLQHSQPIAEITVVLSQTLLGK